MKSMRPTLALALIFSLLPLLASAQTPVLLNINSSTYPTRCTVANYQYLGVAGLSGTELINQFSPAFNVALMTPMNFTNGSVAELINGPVVMTMSRTNNGGTWVKSTGVSSTNGLMDCYFWNSDAATRTITLSNLNLTAGTNYTLYVIGMIPASGVTEDGLFQPVNTPNITFTSTTAGHGVVAFPFTTSASYTSADLLQFTWGKYSSFNPCLQGVAIVPGEVGPPTQSLTISNGVQKYASLTNTTMTLSGKCELWVSVIHKWGLQDLAGAVAWVNLFPDGQLKERAIKELEGIVSHQQSWREREQL